MKSLTRTMFASLFFSGLILLGYWKLTLDQQAQALREMQAINDQMKQALAARQAMIERLSRSRRMAHLKVTEQKLDASGKPQTTSLLFIELDDNGAELARQAFTVPGNIVFVDALTVKFDAEHVAMGDPMMGKTLVLLRRIYSEAMLPQDGFEIDTPGAIPPGYAASDVSRFEQNIWASFWEIATDPEKARSLGVRVAQGEAVYKPVRVGQTFELLVDAAGGMNLTPIPEDASLTQAER